MAQGMPPSPGRLNLGIGVGGEHGMNRGSLATLQFGRFVLSDRLRRVGGVNENLAILFVWPPVSVVPDLSQYGRGVSCEFVQHLAMAGLWLAIWSWIWDGRGASSWTIFTAFVDPCGMRTLPGNWASWIQHRSGPRAGRSSSPGPCRQTGSPGRIVIVVRRR